MRTIILLFLFLSFVPAQQAVATQDTKAIQNALEYGASVSVIYTEMGEIHGALDEQEMVYLDFFSNDMTPEELEEIHTSFIAQVTIRIDAYKTSSNAMKVPYLGKMESLQWLKASPEYLIKMAEAIDVHFVMVLELYSAAYDGEAETFNSIQDGSFLHTVDIIKFENMYIEMALMSARKDQPQIGLTKASIATNEFLIVFMDLVILLRAETVPDVEEFNKRFQKAMDSQKSAINLTKRKMKNYRKTQRKLANSQEKDDQLIWPYIFDIGESYKRGIAAEEGLLTSMNFFTKKVVESDFCANDYFEQFQLVGIDFDAGFQAQVNLRIEEHNERIRIAQEMLAKQQAKK